MKVNFDTTFKKQENKSCSGIETKYNGGQVLSSKVVINENLPLSFEIEVLACIQSSQLGLDLGFLKVEMEGDALSIIRKYKEKMRTNKKSRHTLEMGKALAKGMKVGEQLCLRDGVPKFAKKDVERDGKEE
ncbi:hypothetical protein Gorai_023144, partial [Gossypium raimondii]|nr:hypothetical protein [Gossypium raimondii]